MTVLGAFSMVILLAFAAFLIDIAWMSVIQTEAQVASDIAARGALTAFINDNSKDSFAAREARAQQIGKTIFESHKIGRAPIEIDAAEVDFGVLNRNNNNFRTDARWANSVRINMDQVKPGGFPLFLAPIVFGTDSFNAPARSTTSFRPIDVVLCLDISRSMSRPPGSLTPLPGGGFNDPPVPGSRWLALVDSVELFLSRAQTQIPSLRVSLVTFGGGKFQAVKTPWDDTSSRVETDLEFIGAARNTIDDRMTFITMNTLALLTPIKEGITDATSVLTTQSDENANRVMILLSDGAATSGSPTAAAEAAGAEGITIHTIYFASATEAGAAPLETVAMKTGGRSLDADDPLALDDAFNQVLALLSVSLVE